MKRVAVVLCGSGFRDGSEIRESVATLLALSKHAATVQCFAPDQAQVDVVNCLTGDIVSDETRNMLVESARIARGQVQALDALQVNDFDALILPGGFGVAKNLCNFASAGHRGKVLPVLAHLLQKFQVANKPIGAICIAPAVLALAFQGKGLELTLGTYGEAAQEIERLGHKHIACSAAQCHVDLQHKIVSTPAYMIDDAPLHQIFAGIEALVTETLALS